MSDAMSRWIAPVSDELPPVPASGRVEGWVRYYEYFHKLNADMQAKCWQACGESFAVGGRCVPGRFGGGALCAPVG